MTALRCQHDYTSIHESSINNCAFVHGHLTPSGRTYAPNLHQSNAIKLWLALKPPSAFPIKYQICSFPLFSKMKIIGRNKFDWRYILTTNRWSPGTTTSDLDWTLPGPWTIRTTPRNQGQAVTRLVSGRSGSGWKLESSSEIHLSG